MLQLVPVSYKIGNEIWLELEAMFSLWLLIGTVSLQKETPRREEEKDEEENSKK